MVESVFSVVPILTTGHHLDWHSGGLQRSPTSSMGFLDPVAQTDIHSVARVGLRGIRLLHEVALLPTWSARARSADAAHRWRAIWHPG